MTPPFATQQEAEESIANFAGFRKEARDATKRGDKLADGFREYHDEHPEIELYDGEHGLTVTFTNVSTTQLDLVNMPNDIVLWGAASGLFNLNGTVWRALKESGGGDHAMIEKFKKFVMTGEGKPRVGTRKD